MRVRFCNRMNARPSAGHSEARMEEARQAHSVAAISDLAEPIGGGLMCFAGAGSFANQAMGVGMDGPVDAARSIASLTSMNAAALSLDWSFVRLRMNVHSWAGRGADSWCRRLRMFSSRSCERLICRRCRRESVIERVNPANQRLIDEHIEIAVAGFNPPNVEVVLACASPNVSGAGICRRSVHSLTAMHGHWIM